MTKAIVVRVEGDYVITAQGADLLSAIASQASDARDEAVSAAAAALAAAGVGEYPDTGAGLSGTTEGETFWVDLGDGTGQVYRHDPGPTATPLQKFIIDPTDSGAAALLGAADGETAQQHFDRMRKVGTASYEVGSEFAEVDPSVRGSWAFGQYDASNKNIVGKNGVKPNSDPPWGSRTAEANYVAGSAEVSAVLAGYDNIANALASLVASQHSMVYHGADHSSIFGGSLHTIFGNAQYSHISSGTSSRIEHNSSYSYIAGGENNWLANGGTTATSGFRSFIAAGQSNKIMARNGVILSSVGCTITGTATYGTILAGETITLQAGAHVLVGGSNMTIGASASAAYSIIWGDGHLVNGSRCLVVGDTHTVAHDYSVATGTKCIVPFVGARVHGARHRGNVAGNHMALDFQCSQETTAAATVRLSVVGASTFPVQPANSVVTGTFYVSGVKDDGTSAAWCIDFSSVMGASGAPTIKGLSVTELHDDLTVTDPTINATADGIYRVQVVGLASANIRWSARFVGQQVVFA